MDKNVLECTCGEKFMSSFYFGEHSRKCKATDDLKTKNDALVARVDRLESVIDKVDMYHGHCHDKKCSNESNNECECGHVDAQVTLNETESESLAHIHAAIIQKVLDCRELNLSQGDIDTIKLIQKGKGHG